MRTNVITIAVNNGITFISKDCPPRDKVNERHILSIIGSRYKHSPDKIQSEIMTCQEMKSKFLNYARNPKSQK